MKILSGPRGIIAFDESEAALQKIADQWPSETLRIGEHKPRESKNSSRRGRSSA